MLSHAQRVLQLRRRPWRAHSERGKMLRVVIDLLWHMPIAEPKWRHPGDQVAPLHHAPHRRIRPTLPRNVRVGRSEGRVTHARHAKRPNAVHLDVVASPELHGGEGGKACTERMPHERHALAAEAGDGCKHLRPHLRIRRGVAMHDLALRAPISCAQALRGAPHGPHLKPRLQVGHDIPEVVEGRPWERDDALGHTSGLAGERGHVAADVVRWARAEQAW
mmetsp:Transcript_45983/g.127667  ORF Transcript_45983/g.127667 Transcript_45983/m.127667 type:complete len:220 (+) Transcript_45983:372-1031(+)